MHEYIFLKAEISEILKILFASVRVVKFRKFKKKKTPTSQKLAPKNLSSKKLNKVQQGKTPSICIKYLTLRFWKVSGSNKVLLKPDLQFSKRETTLSWFT